MLQERSKSHPEPSKTTPRGIKRPFGRLMRLRWLSGHHCVLNWTSKWAPRDLKKTKADVLQVFQVSAHVTTSCSRPLLASLSKPLGPPLGALLESRRPPRSPKRTPRGLQGRPQRLPRTPPGPSQDPSGPPCGRSRDPWDAQKDPQDTSKRHPRGLFIQPGLDSQPQVRCVGVAWQRALGPPSQARRNARERLNLLESKINK